MLNYKLNNYHQKNNSNNKQIKQKSRNLECNKNNKIKKLQEQTQNQKSQVLVHLQMILIIDIYKKYINHSKSLMFEFYYSYFDDQLVLNRE